MFVCYSRKSVYCVPYCFWTVVLLSMRRLCVFLPEIAPLINVRFMPLCFTSLRREINGHAMGWNLWVGRELRPITEPISWLPCADRCWPWGLRALHYSERWPEKVARYRFQLRASDTHSNQEYWDLCPSKAVAVGEISKQSASVMSKQQSLLLLLPHQF